MATTIISTHIANTVQLNTTNTVMTITPTGTVQPGSGVLAIQIYEVSNGTVINSGSVIATGDDDLTALFPTTVENFGIITETGGSGWHNLAMYAGGYVLNASGGIISGMNNIYVKNTGITVVNNGLIQGNAAANGSGILFYATSGTDFVNNQTHGTINAGYGVYSSVGATVVNAGTIAGYKSEGVWMKGSGTVTNQAGGIITGGTGTSAGPFGGLGIGVVIGVPGAGTGVGVITNAGTISSVVEDGMLLADGGSISNTATGLIKGTFGIVIQAAGATITNAATIDGTGGTAVSMATGVTNRLIVDPGAVFTGKANGGTAADATLELASGASQGTLSGGLGANYINFQTVQVDSTANWLIDLTSAATPSYTFTSIGNLSTIDVTGFTATSHTTLTGGTGLVLTNASAAHVTLHFAASIGTHYTVTTGAFGTDITNICFCRGTQILTPDGEVGVESLSVGDLVVTKGSAEPRKITWIGKGQVLATRGKRGPATPVIVRKGALAPNVPNRDLHVTKAHSLYFDGVFVPAEFLVNHRSIVWDDRAQEVEIYHIELESHDVLIANGAEAESYRDDGNRWLFRNANDGWHLPPKDACAPVLTGGPVVDAIWSRLLDRAGPRKLPAMTDDADLHLIVDGQWIDVSRREGAGAVFYIPWQPRSVRIVSHDVVPAELGLARDPRSLGVALRRIAVSRGVKLSAMDAADPRLADGFHDYERAGDLRWTNGNAMVPSGLFDCGGYGAFKLVLTLGGATQYPEVGAAA